MSQLLAELATREASSSVAFARLKVDLLAEGLRVSRGAKQLVARAKPPLRVRSGACGGLDVVLRDGTYVNCPVREHFVAGSPYELVAHEDELYISGPGREGVDDVARLPVTLVPTPAYYSALGSDGTPLSRVAQLCSDRLGVGMTNICSFWRSRSRRCKYCSIGLNVRDEESNKRLDQILEATAAALEDPVAPARHVLLGGGTPEGPDAGAAAIARTAAAMKERWDVSIYAMIAPPSDLSYLDLLRSAGVDEIGLNVELFDREAAARYLPGKNAAIGLDASLHALEHAVEVFGPVSTRSIAIVGLEDEDSTVAGAETLASMGVMPILSPFRPLVGTELEHHPRFSGEKLWRVTEAAAEAAARHDMPLGPTCIPCQSNTLTMPGRPEYRDY